MFARNLSPPVDSKAKFYLSKHSTLGCKLNSFKKAVRDTLNFQSGRDAQRSNVVITDGWALWGCHTG